MQWLEHSLAAPKWPNSKPGFSVYTLVDFVVGSLPRGSHQCSGFLASKSKISKFQFDILSTVMF